MQETDDLWSRHGEQLKRLLRYTGYSAVLAGLLGSLPFFARKLGPGPQAFTGDGSAIEWVQFSILMAVVGLWGWGAWRHELYRASFLFLACVSSLAAIRELDYVLDHWIPVLSWKAPGLLALLAGAWVVWTERKRFFRQMLELSATPGFSVLWAGLLIVVLFAQMVGHGPFLKALFAEQFVYEYKRLIEEMGEAFGYALILIGTVEVLHCCRRKGNIQKPGLQSAKTVEFDR
jgi:hypothetical protein